MAGKTNKPSEYIDYDDDTARLQQEVRELERFAEKLGISLEDDPTPAAALPAAPPEGPGFWDRAKELGWNILRGGSELAEGAGRIAQDTLFSEEFNLPFTGHLRDDQGQVVPTPLQTLPETAKDFYKQKAVEASQGDPSIVSEVAGNIISELPFPGAALNKVKGVWPLLKEGSKLLPINLGLETARGIGEMGHLPETEDDYKMMATRLGITGALTPPVGGAFAKFLGQAPAAMGQIDEVLDPQAIAKVSTPAPKPQVPAEDILAKPPLIQAPQDLSVPKAPPMVPKGDMMLPQGNIQGVGGDVSTVVDQPFDPTMVPRHFLPDEANAEISLRAMKGQADLDIAGKDRGFKNFSEVDGQGGTPEIVSGKSPTPEWFKDVTHGPKKLSAERVQVALEKIQKDKGLDVGKDVQRVKEALLNDPEFHMSEFAPKTDEEWTEAVRMLSPEGAADDLPTTSPVSGQFIEPGVGDAATQAMSHVQPQTLGEAGAIRVGPTPLPAPTSPHAFAAPGMEETFQAGKQALGTPGMWAKAKETMADFVHGWTRTFKDLPNTPQFAKANETLSQLKHAGRFATEKAGRIMRGITHDLSPEEFDLFERLIILRDSNQDVLKGLPLPGEWTPQGVQAELMRAEAALLQSPKVQRAIDLRMQMITELKDQLIAAKVLKIRPGQENEFYFPHLVRDYAEDVIKQAEAGTGMSVKKRTPWFAKERKGTDKLYNFNYLEAELAYLQKAYTDLEMARVIQKMKDDYDILPRLQQQARQWNQAHPNDPPKTWKDMPLPDGYTAYQVDPSATFYSAFSTSESVIDDTIAGLADALARKDKALIDTLITDSLQHYPEELGEIVERLRPSLIFGGPKAPMIVPDELAKTLTKMGRKEQLAPLRKLNGAIKEWLLIAPHKVWRYTFNNFVGDMEAVWVGNSKILTDGRFRPSVKELWKIFRGQAPPTQDYLDALRLGVIDTGQITTELTDINNFADLMMIDPRRHATWGQMATDLIKKGWGSIRKWNQFRENMLRYAAYKHYKDALDTGKTFSYGGSRPELVDALGTNEEKAAKMARELLGDYAAVSEYGQNVSNHFMMFYRWMEVNATRYTRLIHNAQQEANLGGMAGKTAAAQTVNMGLRLAKLMTWMGLVGMWNKYVIGEDWEKLPKHGREMPNVVMPMYRDENGQPRYIRTEGSFADFLRTLGWDDTIEAVQGVLDGGMTWGEALLQTVKAAPEAVIERVVQGTYPHMSGAYEVATGKTLWPDISNPKDIRDPARHIAEKFGLKHGYDLALGDKEFNEEDALLDLFSYKVDPKTDYFESKGEAADWKERMGGGRYSGTSAEDPEKDVLHDWIDALRKNDAQAMQKLMPFVEEIIDGDLDKYKRMMNNLDPALATGLGKTESSKYQREAFLESLDPEKRRRYDRAFEQAKQIRQRDPFRHLTKPGRKKDRQRFEAHWGF